MKNCEIIKSEILKNLFNKKASVRVSSEPKLTCNFESDINPTCDWIQEETRDSEDW